MTKTMRNKRRLPAEQRSGRLRSRRRVSRATRYSVVCFYRGRLDVMLDRKLREIAGQGGDSGMFPWSSIRDLEFYYSTLTKAKVVARRFKSVKPNLIVMVRSFQRA